MAVKVKDAASSAAKFVARAQAAGGDYTKGVQGAGDTWMTNSLAAKGAFAEGINAAISRDAFSKGIQKSGAANYVARATGVGSNRYPQGVATAAPKWQANTQPYLDTIAGLTLPPKGPRGNPGNLNRVAMIATALRAKKVGA